VTWVSTGVIIYSSFITVRNTGRVFSEDRLLRNMDIIYHKKRGHAPSAQVSSQAIRQARKENFMMLWNAWKPALPWMALEWLIAAVAGFILETARRTVR